ncbi:MAG: SIS domain-containing protein [Phycisphaerales bacterium JB059]
MSEIVAREFDDAAMALRAFNADASNAERVEQLADACAASIRSGGKVLAIGNGGSCADAMHFCEELTGRYREDRPSLPAIACIDPGHLTCTANDYGFEQVFSRWVEGLGREGDVLVAMSTSGNSANIVRAVEAARSGGLSVALLLGKDGGRLRGLGDFEWIAPGETSDRIQEIHMLVLHALVGAIERHAPWDR